MKYVANFIQNMNKQSHVYMQSKRLNLDLNINIICQCLYIYIKYIQYISQSDFLLQ